MNGNKIFVDTNICIYLLNGDKVIADLLNGYIVYISFITEIELYAYHSVNDSVKNVLDEFMSSVNIIDISYPIKTNTIRIRKTKQVKIPDAIIAASAWSLNLSLVTADKALSKLEDLKVIMYDPK